MSTEPTARTYADWTRDHPTYADLGSFNSYGAAKRGDGPTDTPTPDRSALSAEQEETT